MKDYSSLDRFKEWIYRENLEELWNYKWKAKDPKNNPMWDNLHKWLKVLKSEV
jgi:hypothetical protein